MINLLFQAVLNRGFRFRLHWSSKVQPKTVSMITLFRAAV